MVAKKLVRKNPPVFPKPPVVVKSPVVKKVTPALMAPVPPEGMSRMGKGPFVGTEPRAKKEPQTDFRVTPDGVVLSKVAYSPEGVVLKVLKR